MSRFPPRTTGSVGAALRDHFGRELPRLWPAYFAVALLACVLVPLPTPVVDLLLSLSLGAALVLLVAALRVERVAELTVFPTLLLLVTLYRLALNVSTTRLILSQADAGRVVDAFANVVVRSDLIVGAVIFGVITLIQYLVIARGAERVAEVTARFALDALPGQQASIDADLRNGALSPQQASERRDELLERSMFHGAMDGAIRFVRHDAVAGLCITSINLLGGLAVGLFRLDLSLSESLDTFGRLTIGDGLLSQIPAVLVSLAASVLVSRVDRRESSRWLSPAMLVVPATALLLLALMPGMPTAAFSVASLGLLAAAAWLARQRHLAPTVASDRPPVAFVVSPADFPEPNRLARGLAALRSRCSEALDLDLPPFVVEVANGSPAGRVDIRHQRARIGGLELGSDNNREASLWLNGYRAILAHGRRFCDLQTIDERIEQVAQSKPAIAQEARRVVDRTTLLSLCRGLLDERLPMPDMTELLQLCATDLAFRDPQARSQWLEIVRTGTAASWMIPLIEEAMIHPHRPWHATTPDFERMVLDACEQTNTGLRIIASVSEQQQWRDALTRTNQNDVPVAGVITSPRARVAVARLFHDATCHVPVVSRSELLAAEFTPPETRWIDAPMGSRATS